MDEMEGSKYLFSIDLASGFLQLEIHEDDRHLKAFRDTEGKLIEYVRCGFGLTVLSVSANYVGGRLSRIRESRTGWTTPPSGRKPLNIDGDCYEKR